MICAQNYFVIDIVYFFYSEEILKALNSAIDRQLEGIVLKEPKSLYKANSRKSGWYKIKPEVTFYLIVLI